MKKIFKFSVFNRHRFLKKWPVPHVIEEPLLIPIIGATEYIITKAKLPKDIELLNVEAVEKQIKWVRTRLCVYFTTLVLLIVVIPLAVLMSWLFVKYDMTVFWIVITALLIMSIPVLLLLIFKVSQNNQSVSIKTVLNENLSEPQKETVTAIVEEMIQSKDNFYLKGNQEQILTVPGRVLTAENAFLLLIGGPKLYKKIMLTGRSIKRKVFVHDDLKAEKAEPPETNELESNEPEPNQPHLYKEYGLSKNTQACLHLKVVSARKKFLYELVRAAAREQENGYFKKAFVPKIRAYRIIMDNHQNWKSLMKGNVQSQLELKLRTALCPDDPEGEEAKEKLKEFLKPGNRRFNEYVAGLIDIPKELIDEQAKLFKKKTKKN